MAKTRVVAGIDIGSSKIATLISQYNDEEGKVSIVGVSSVSSKGVRKGQIVDIEEAAESVIESVERAERMAGYSLDRAFVSIGGGHIDSRNSHGVVAVADPSGEIDSNDVERVIDAARAISMPEAREIIHVLPREYKVDGETEVKDPRGMSGIRLEVDTHLITASSTAAKNAVKCVSEVGASVESLVFSGLAASQSSLTDTEKELGVVLVDVGGGTTSIAVFVEGSIAYSSVLPIGGKNVTNDIAAGLRLSLDSAEKIKLALGEKYRKQKALARNASPPTSATLGRDAGGGSEDEGAKEDELELSGLGIEDSDKKVSTKTLVEGIIKPRLNEIFTMVGMQLQEAGVSGKTPSGVVITGGGALCVGAQEAARRMLSLPVRIGKPRGVTGLIDEIEDPSFAVGVGLILFGVKTGAAKVSPSWPSLDIFSRLEGFKVKGLVGKASKIIKNLLP